MAIADNYNALSIDQAHQLVCAPNMELLHSAVVQWKKLSQLGYLPTRRDLVFEDSFREME